mmetsp:Transcript_47697/g.118142  ORF Transcript_47697/g.118142 Transcript_47697/m.118142 type:complete len:157 (-) Transcript_47697:322-792(-)
MIFYIGICSIVSFMIWRRRMRIQRARVFTMSHAARTTSHNLRASETAAAQRTVDSLATTIVPYPKDTSAAAPGCQAAEKDCAVCLEPFEPGAVLRLLPCLHSFHQQCIDKWLLNRPRGLDGNLPAMSCPLCKHDPRIALPPAATKRRADGDPLAPA